MLGTFFMGGATGDRMDVGDCSEESRLSTSLWIKGFTMRRLVTLVYWRDGDWYVGRIMEIPAVFSQGESLDALRENIQEAYELMVTQDLA